MVNNGRERADNSYVYKNTISKLSFLVILSSLFVAIRVELDVYTFCMCVCVCAHYYLRNPMISADCDISSEFISQLNGHPPSKCAF